MQREMSTEKWKIKKKLLKDLMDRNKKYLKNKQDMKIKKVIIKIKNK